MSRVDTARTRSCILLVAAALTFAGCENGRSSAARSTDTPTTAANPVGQEGSAATPTGKDERTNKPKAPTNRWEKAIRAFEASDREEMPPAGAVLFTGSSSARLWKVGKHFPNHETINRGFGGSQYSDLLHYVDRVVLPYRPRTIVIYSGDNDIAAGESPDEIVQEVRRLLDRIHAGLPKTKVILLSVKLCDARWDHRGKVKRMNKLLEKLAGRHAWVHYLDVAGALLDEKAKPRPELFRKDKLHLNDAGYHVWSDVLRPLL